MSRILSIIMGMGLVNTFEERKCHQENVVCAFSWIVWV